MEEAGHEPRDRHRWRLDPSGLSPLGVARGAVGVVPGRGPREIFEPGPPGEGGGKVTGSMGNPEPDTSLAWRVRSRARQGLFPQASERETKRRLAVQRQASAESESV